MLTFSAIDFLNNHHLTWAEVHTVLEDGYKFLQNIAVLILFIHFDIHHGDLIQLKKISKPNACQVLKVLGFCFAISALYRLMISQRLRQGAQKRRMQA